MAAEIGEKIRWTRSKIKLLIALVEKKPCLWDVTNKDYRNQSKRRSALAGISSQLEMPYEEVKKKLHTLRAQHCKERIKIKTKKSASGLSAVYRPKWEFFDSMQYMFRHNASNETIISVGTETNHHENSSECVESQPASPEVMCKFPNPKKRKNIRSTGLQEQAAISRCMDIVSNANEKDEDSIFGEFVASEIRQLKNSPDLKFKLKSIIQKSILEVSTENASRKFLVQPEPKTQQFTASLNLPPSISGKNFSSGSGSTNSEQKLPNVSSENNQLHYGYY